MDSQPAVTPAGGPAGGITTLVRIKPYTGADTISPWYIATKVSIPNE